MRAATETSEYKEFCSAMRERSGEWLWKEECKTGRWDHKNLKDNAIYCIRCGLITLYYCEGKFLDAPHQLSFRDVCICGCSGPQKRDDYWTWITLALAAQLQRELSS